MACTRLISAAVPQRETSESGLRARSRYHHVSLFAALLKNALSKLARPLSPSPRSERLLQRVAPSPAGACGVPKARATHAPSAPWPGSPALTYARACTGRLISSAMATPLYGGALVATLPAGWIDASDLRPVPDNQEVSLAATQCLLASGCCTQACYHPGVDGARGCRALAGHRAHGETRRHGRGERGTPLRRASVWERRPP